MRARANLLVIVLLGACVVTTAQDSLQLRVDVQLVTVDAYVDDAAGKPLTTLTRGDFAILDNGEPREIQTFDSAENPYNILLLFDRSSSTESQWPFLVRAISRFLAQLPEQHRVALAAFDDKPEMLLDWRSAQELTRRSFNIPSNNSGTNVYRAVEWAIQELRGVKGRKGVIVFTDGVDNRLSQKLVSFDKSGTPSVAPPEADNDFQKMLRLVTQNGAPVFFVAVNTDRNPDPRSPPNSFDLKQRQAARIRMEAVAGQSNGAIHFPKQIEDVGSLYERIGRELGYAYSLGFAPGKGASNNPYHRIEIRVRDKSMRVTQLRQEYYAR